MDLRIRQDTAAAVAIIKHDSGLVAIPRLHAPSIPHPIIKQHLHPRAYRIQILLPKSSFPGTFAFPSPLLRRTDSRADLNVGQLDLLRFRVEGFGLASWVRF